MYNAEGHIVQVLEAILAQEYPAPIEVIVVNDGSTDSSLDKARHFEGRGGVGGGARDIRVMDQPNQGAVAATNNGFTAARHDIVCSVDSDVVLERDWLKKIIEEFRDPRVGAVQGYYRTPQGVSFWARMMGYDVEARYDSIRSKCVTQVCTGDTAYRRAALDEVGLFDPAFKYGYDNDMSYRLVKAGYKLIFRKDAKCDHYWKQDFASYVKQQYQSAYGRMQLVRKHTERVVGDSVSGVRMMAQVPLTLLFFFLLFSGIVLKILCPGVVDDYMLLGAFACLAVICVDRFLFTIPILLKHRDPAAVLLPVVHLMRNTVWVWAFLRWGLGLK